MQRGRDGKTGGDTWSRRLRILPLRRPIPPERMEQAVTSPGLARPGIPSGDSSEGNTPGRSLSEPASLIAVPGAPYGRSDSTRCRISCSPRYRMSNRRAADTRIGPPGRGSSPRSAPAAQLPKRPGSRSSALGRSAWERDDCGAVPAPRVAGRAVLRSLKKAIYLSRRDDTILNGLNGLTMGFCPRMHDQFICAII